MAIQPHMDNGQNGEQEYTSLHRWRIFLLGVAWSLLAANLFYGVSLLLFRPQSLVQTLVPTLILGSLSLMLALITRRFPSPLPAPAVAPIQHLPYWEDDEQLVPAQIQNQPRPVFFFNAPLPDNSEECKEEFFGRTKERRELFGAILERQKQSIHRKQSVSIVNPKRIGKTWLINYLICRAELELGLNYRVGYLNAALPSCSTISGFTMTALRGLHCDQFVPSPLGKLTLTQLAQAVRYLRQTRQEIPILCIDEFERFEDRNAFDLNFFNEFRAITEMGLVLIVASRKPLTEVVLSEASESPFFNIFKKLDLGPFTDEEAHEFIEKKGQQAGFTQQEQAHLKEIKKPAPALLQLAGQILLDDKQFFQLYPDYYNMNDENYWKDFWQRLDRQYEQINGVEKQAAGTAK